MKPDAADDCAGRRALRRAQKSISAPPAISQAAAGLGASQQGEDRAGAIEMSDEAAE